jgi:hypothetical protein
MSTEVDKSWMKHFRVPSSISHPPDLTPLQRAIRHHGLLEDAGADDETLDHMMVLVHQASRNEFQDHHGFETWDDTWNTLWTIKTGYKIMR